MAKKKKDEKITSTDGSVSAIQVNEGETKSGKVKAFLLKAENRLRPKQTAKEPASDPFKEYYDSFSLIEPIYDPNVLVTFPEYCTILNPLIETMVTNIVGFGHILKERKTIIDGLDKSHPLRREFKQYKLDIHSEKLDLEFFFANAGTNESFTNLRKKRRRDLETMGFAAWEVVPGNGQEIGKETPDIAYFVHIPAQEIRMSGEDQEFTLYNTKRYMPNKKTGVPEIITLSQHKRFRKFCQVRSNSNIMTWFKEFDDPRVLDRNTGVVITEEKMDEWEENGGQPAHELLFFKRDVPAFPHYGAPRWSAEILQADGIRGADEINYQTMLKNNVPSMMLLVSGGDISPGSIDRIKEYIDTQVSGDNNYSKFLILNAEASFDRSATLSSPDVKISVERMDNIQMKDELFQNFIKNSLERIREAFRISPIYLGRVSDFNRATAIEARRVTDEQVFAPERDDEDYFVNNFILPRKGILWHMFRSNTPNITDAQTLTELLKNAVQTGAVTPAIATEIMELILGMELSEYPNKIDPDIPFPIQFAKAQKYLEQQGTDEEEKPKKKVDVDDEDIDDDEKKDKEK